MSESARFERPPDNTYVVKEPWEDALHGSDRGWYDVSGNCGGCGDQNCHPGTPCTIEDDKYHLIGHDICGICPDRREYLKP